MVVAGEQQKSRNPVVQPVVSSKKRRLISTAISTACTRRLRELCRIPRESASVLEVANVMRKCAGFVSS